MSGSKDPRVTLFETYLATAEKVSDRRAQANAWMLSVTSAIVALYGYLQTDKTLLSLTQKPVWLWAIPAAGILASLAWGSLLSSYRKLNQAKFTVLQEIEKAFGEFAPFSREEEIYRKEGRWPLAEVESLIPGCFAVLFLVLMGANFIK